MAEALEERKKDEETGPKESMYNSIVFYFTHKHQSCSVSWAVEYTDCFSAEAIRPPSKRISWYDTKQSDGEVPIMPEFWGMWSTSS